MRKGRELRRGAALGCAAAILVLGGASRADQHVGEAAVEEAAPIAEARTLAAQIVETLDALRTVSTDAPMQDTAMQQRTRDAAVVEMRHVASMASDYVERLGESEELRDTEFLFRNLRTAVDDALETAGDAEAPPASAKQLARLDALLTRLAALYAGEG